MLNRLAATLLAIAVVSLVGVASAKETRKIDALGAWSATGGGVPSADGSILFVGVFKGVIYVAKGEDFLNAARLLCTATMRIGVTLVQHGKGNCVITSAKGRLFARYECKGVRLVGCKGYMTISGGQGRFKGATGGGSFFVRSGFERLFQGQERIGG